MPYLEENDGNGKERIKTTEEGGNDAALPNLGGIEELLREATPPNLEGVVDWILLSGSGIVFPSALEGERYSREKFSQFSESVKRYFNQASLVYCKDETFWEGEFEKLNETIIDTFIKIALIHPTNLMETSNLTTIEKIASDLAYQFELLWCAEISESQKMYLLSSFIRFLEKEGHERLIKALVSWEFISSFCELTNKNKWKEAEDTLRAESTEIRAPILKLIVNGSLERFYSIFKRFSGSEDDELSLGEIASYARKIDLSVKEADWTRLIKSGEAISLRWLKNIGMVPKKWEKWIEKEIQTKEAGKKKKLLERKSYLLEDDGTDRRKSSQHQTLLKFIDELNQLFTSRMITDDKATQMESQLKTILLDKKWINNDRIEATAKNFIQFFLFPLQFDWAGRNLDDLTIVLGKFFEVMRFGLALAPCNFVTKFLKNQKTTKFIEYCFSLLLMYEKHSVLRKLVNDQGFNAICSANVFWSNRRYIFDYDKIYIELKNLEKLKEQCSVSHYFSNWVREGLHYASLVNFFISSDGYFDIFLRSYSCTRDKPLLKVIFLEIFSQFKRNPDNFFYQSCFNKENPKNAFLNFCILVAGALQLDLSDFVRQFYNVYPQKKFNYFAKDLNEVIRYFSAVSEKNLQENYLDDVASRPHSLDEALYFFLRLHQNEPNVDTINLSYKKIRLVRSNQYHPSEIVNLGRLFGVIQSPDLANNLISYLFNEGYFSGCSRFMPLVRETLKEGQEVNCGRCLEYLMASPSVNWLAVFQRNLPYHFNYIEDVLRKNPECRSAFVKNIESYIERLNKQEFVEFFNSFNEKASPLKSRLTFALRLLDCCETLLDCIRRKIRILSSSDHFSQRELLILFPHSCVLFKNEQDYFEALTCKTTDSDENDCRSKLEKCHSQLRRYYDYQWGECLTDTINDLQTNSPPLPIASNPHVLFSLKTNKEDCSSPKRVKAIPEGNHSATVSMIV